jgi:hypothetical protein
MLAAVAGLLPLGNVLVLSLAACLGHLVRVRRRKRGEPTGRWGWFLVLGSLAFGLSVACVVLGAHEWYLEWVGPPIQGLMRVLGWVSNAGDWEASWMRYGVVPVLICVLMSGPGLLVSGLGAWFLGIFWVLEGRWAGAGAGAGCDPRGEGSGTGAGVGAGGSK